MWDNKNGIKRLIREKQNFVRVTTQSMAKDLRIDQSTFNKKLNDPDLFRLKELKGIMNLLKMSKDEKEDLMREINKWIS